MKTYDIKLDGEEVHDLLEGHLVTRVLREAVINITVVKKEDSIESGANDGS